LHEKLKENLKNWIVIDIWNKTEKNWQLKTRFISSSINAKELPPGFILKEEVINKRY
jgi:hypothetical protein